MEKLMKAICLTTDNSVKLQNVLKPERAEQEHLLIKMEACGINAGDIAFIAGAFPYRIIVSRYNVAGVSGVGTVIAIGEGVPEKYKGKNVTVYRSLKATEDMIGTWSEYAHLHYLSCTILPNDVNIEEYAGSLVNIITPYAFLKQIEQEGHKGIVCTAGNSATGVAMLGICLYYRFPLISIVRNENGKKELEELGAKNILVQDDANFKQQLKEVSQQLRATAIFDGVGGAILNNIIDVVPANSTIYCYGYLGGQTPLTIHTKLMQGITIKGFSNFRTETVQNPNSLETALNNINSIIDMPHFKTKIEKKFKFDEANEALAFSSSTGGKAILYPLE